LDCGLTFYRTPHVGKTPTAGSFVAVRALPQPGAWNQDPLPGSLVHEGPRGGEGEAAMAVILIGPELTY
jgi:hypothetical protein